MFKIANCNSTMLPDVTIKIAIQIIHYNERVLTLGMSKNNLISEAGTDIFALAAQFREAFTTKRSECKRAKTMAH